MGKQWLPLESNPEVMDTYLRGCGAAVRGLPSRPVRCPDCLYALPLHSLGFPSTYVCHDVYGFDPDLLAMARARWSNARCSVALTTEACRAQVPSPVRAVLLLFPITPASEAAKAEQEARIANEGQQARPQRCARQRVEDAWA